MFVCVVYWAGSKKWQDRGKPACICCCSISSSRTCPPPQRLRLSKRFRKWPDLKEVGVLWHDATRRDGSDRHLRREPPPHVTRLVLLQDERGAGRFRSAPRLSTFFYSSLSFFGFLIPSHFPLFSAKQNLAARLTRARIVCHGGWAET